MCGLLGRLQFYSICLFVTYTMDIYLYDCVLMHIQAVVVMQKEKIDFYIIIMHPSIIIYRDSNYAQQEG